MTGDMISRQAAIDLVKDVCDAIMSCCGSHYDEETDDEVYDDIREIDAILKCNKEMRIALKNMPSAEPERKTGRWIPCSERLPEEPYGCLVTVWDTNIITMDEFENILPYFVGWDGEQWNDADGEQCPFEVIAWMPLPEPYREEGEE